MEHADPNTFVPQIAAALAIVLMAFAVSAYHQTLYTWVKQTRVWQAIIMSRASVDDEGTFPGTSTHTPDTRAVVPLSVPPLGTSTEPVPDRPEPLEKSDIMISRRMPMYDQVVLLATQQDEDGKYLYSANAIAVLIGKRRNDVLDLIREVREPAPPFKPKAVYRELDEDGKPILTHTA